MQAERHAFERVAKQRLGALGEHHLSSVTHRADPCGPIDVDAHVVVAMDLRLAGVDRHTHRDGPACERLLGVARGGSRVAGGREGEEQGVALAAKPDAVVARGRASQQAVVLGQQVGIPAPVLLRRRVEPSMSVNSIETVPRGSPRPVRRCCQRRVVAEDGLVKLAKLGTRLEAQFLDQGLSGDTEGLDRIRLPPASVQREHALGVESLAQGVIGEQWLEFRERLGVTALRRSPSMAASRALIRSSSRCLISAAANGSSATSASAGPRHSLRAARASASGARSARSNRSASTASGAT